ncbi:hypothetical protein B0H17DRAFT_478542 [Mycena rosella]|uniref:Uncharacterized protein n=1 Tax=Mycena rosella TaxID=1033263 RepID=A0AAD7C668_MYCRO|nr:hypothetical protein B0H17DRAFT_478542 [Mycena rosella]
MRPFTDKWVKPASKTHLKQWAQCPAPPEFPPASAFDANPEQVATWLARHKRHLGSSFDKLVVEEEDADDDGGDDDEVQSLSDLSLTESVSEAQDIAEEIEVGASLLSFDPATPTATPLATPPRKFRLRQTNKLPLPMASLNVGASRSSPISSYVSRTPAKGRSHATARKYLCAFLLSEKEMRCVASQRSAQLQCAHLLPQSASLTVRSRVAFAIGGRFSANTRINYLILAPDHHFNLDDLDCVFIYAIEQHVLNAIECYLQGLYERDGGSPFAKSKVKVVDFWSELRLHHPILSDGHHYQVRYTTMNHWDSEHPICITRTYSTNKKIPMSPFAEPELPPTSTFANPLFIMVNAIQHLEAGFPDLTWETWRNMLDVQAWAD